MTKILYRVINCKVHKKRLENFRQKAENAGIPHVTRVSCVNGKKFTTRKLCEMVKKGLLKYNSELTPIEVSICLSHAKCWKQLLKSRSADYMVVFEDDCKPYVSFMKKFNEIMEADLDFDILWLYNGNWNRTKNGYEKITTVGKIPIYRETKPYCASGSCYVISKKWAKILYKSMFPIYEAVDNFMGEKRIKTAKHYTVENKKRKDATFDCFTISPLLYVPCPDEGNTTQDFKTMVVKERKLRKCKRKKRLR